LLLSLRHKTNDHLWFAFFHEIAHILKHKKQLFLEEKKEFSNDKVLEDEADKFASDLLIPAETFCWCWCKYHSNATFGT
jgi:Zn-dependent peptidase ImmA (M78 family)